ncbi:MAG: hypothetical protein RLY97_1091 [Pseudomonadota bacterium]|jgi:surfeit locus 1 family protein
MKPRLPLFATLVVFLAVAVMLRLGFWQLERRQEKAALLAHYTAAQAVNASVPFPLDAKRGEKLLYRHSTLTCRNPRDWLALSGRDGHGQSGMMHEALCEVAGGAAHVVIGWSRNPATPAWQGGAVSGIIAARGKHGLRLIANPPLAGLAANALPNPRDIPNNHLSYAVQWFLFAATALVIYGIALRKRMLA